MDSVTVNTTAITVLDMAAQPNISADSGNITASGNETEDDFCNQEQLLIDTLPIQLGFCLLYFIIFFLGFFGNLLVSVVVVKQKHMRNVTNLFILNLAISDVLMCLFAVPFTPLQSFTGKWIFGSVLCR